MAKKQTKQTKQWVTTASIDAIPAGTHGLEISDEGTKFIQFRHADHTLNVNVNYLKLYPHITQQE